MDRLGRPRAAAAAPPRPPSRLWRVQRTTSSREPAPIASAFWALQRISCSSLRSSDSSSPATTSCAPGSWSARSIQPRTGLPDGHLGRDLPARVERPDHDLGHPHLVPVADPRPGLGVHPGREVRAQRGRDPRVRLERGAERAVLHPGEHRRVDAGEARDRGLRAPASSRIRRRSSAKRRAKRDGVAIGVELQPGASHGAVKHGALTGHSTRAGGAGDASRASRSGRKRGRQASRAWPRLHRGDLRVAKRARIMRPTHRA